MRNYECEKCFQIVQSISVPERDGCYHQMGNLYEWHDLGEVGSDIYQCEKCDETIESATTPVAGTCQHGGPHIWCGPMLEVQITPTEETGRAYLDEDDFGESQLSEMVDISRGMDTYAEMISPGDDFEIPVGYEGSISEDLDVAYPRQYLENMDPDVGILQPGHYHWDGKVVTFKRRAKRRSPKRGVETEG